MADRNPQPLHINPSRGADIKTIVQILEPKTKISRASIHLFLTNCVHNELMFSGWRPGQGGDAKVYMLAINENEIRTHLFKKIISRLILELPEEAKEILSCVPDNHDQISNIKLTLTH